MFHFLLTCFILIPPPPSPSFLPCLILFFFSLSWFTLISAPADLSSLTIPCEEEEEEEEEGEKEEEEEEETYDDIDGFDSSNPGSQSRPIILHGSVGLKEPMEEKEEDIYEILPGEKFHLLIIFL